MKLLWTLCPFTDCNAVVSLIEIPHFQLLNKQVDHKNLSSCCLLTKNSWRSTKGILIVFPCLEDSANFCHNAIHTPSGITTVLCHGISPSHTVFSKLLRVSIQKPHNNIRNKYTLFC